MRNRVGRTAMYGVVLGLVTAAVAEAVRPRGGTTLLLDWDQVRRTAIVRLDAARTDSSALAAAAQSYRSLASKLEKPMLDFVGGLPSGTSLPQFEALDREGWLELNITILRRVIEPVLESGRVPNSLVVEVGRVGVNRYVGSMLAFLGHRVLGQYDPQLLGPEPMGGEGLYLVETNVAEWQRVAGLPEKDLRRWLILHEMTHAWQFAANPWLRPFMEESMQVLVDTATRKGHPAARIAAFAGLLPAQWRVMRQVQSVMSVVEGYSNLVMNQLGAKLLPGFEQLEQAYRARTSGKSPLELLIWKLTGLELKMQQYKRGEAFCQAVAKKHGLAALNRVWDGPDSMPALSELGNPEAWYRRVGASSPGALLGPSLR